MLVTGASSGIDVLINNAGFAAVGSVEASRRPRTRYLFATSSRLLVGPFAGVPDRLADALKLRATGVRR